MQAITESRRPGSFLALPGGEIRCAVLVLAGSSGRVDEERARLLARHGAATLALRWFGGPGQPPGICEVPLETFTPALDELHAIHPHLAIIGLSKGAEAALLLAAKDPRIRCVAALSPTSVVWANVGAGLDDLVRPQRSSFTSAGQPLPFVPYDESWQPPAGSGPLAFRELYEQSLRSHTSQVAEATIEVERTEGQVIVSAGGDDQVWPSSLFAHQIADRRSRFGLSTTVIEHPGAGHQIVLPGEEPAAGKDRGESPAADAILGKQLWAELAPRLDLTRPRV